MKAQDKRVENAHKIIGQNVKKAREKAGLTQLQLALAIGHKSVSLVSCAEIYHKKQHFNIEHLLKIAAVLGVSVESFFTGVDSAVFSSNLGVFWEFRALLLGVRFCFCVASHEKATLNLWIATPFFKKTARNDDFLVIFIKMSY